MESPFCEKIDFNNAFQEIAQKKGKTLPADAHISKPNLIHANASNNFEENLSPMVTDEGTRAHENHK